MYGATCYQDFDSILPPSLGEDLRILRTKCSNLEYPQNSSYHSYHSHSVRLTLPSKAVNVLHNAVKHCVCRRQKEMCPPFKCQNRPVLLTNKQAFPISLPPGHPTKDNLEQIRKDFRFVATPLLNPEEFHGPQEEQYFTVTFPILTGIRIHDIYSDLAVKIKEFVDALLSAEKRRAQELNRPLTLTVVLEMCPLFENGISILTARALLMGARELLMDSNIDIEVNLALVPAGQSQIIRCKKHTRHSPLCTVCLRQLSGNMDFDNMEFCQYPQCSSNGKQSKNLKRGPDDLHSGTSSKRQGQGIQSDQQVEIPLESLPQPVPSLPANNRHSTSQEGRWTEDLARSSTLGASGRHPPLSESYARAASTQSYKTTGAAKRHASFQERDPPNLVDMATLSPATSSHSDGAAANLLYPSYLTGPSTHTPPETLTTREVLDNTVQKISDMSNKLNELESQQSKLMSSVTLPEGFKSTIQRLVVLESFQTEMEKFRNKCTSSGLFNNDQSSHLSASQKSIKKLNETARQVSSLESSVSDISTDLQTCMEEVKTLKIKSERRDRSHSTDGASMVSTLRTELTDFKEEVRTSLGLIGRLSLCSHCGFDPMKGQPLRPRHPSTDTAVGDSASSITDITDLTDREEQMIVSPPAQSPLPPLPQRVKPVESETLIVTVSDGGDSAPLEPKPAKSPALANQTKSRAK